MFMWLAGPLGVLAFREALGFDDELKRFWNANCSEPWFQKHPQLDSDMDLNRIIPAYFHFDGVGVGNENELNIWSWSSGVTKAAD